MEMACFDIRTGTFSLAHGSSDACFEAKSRVQAGPWLRRTVSRSGNPLTVHVGTHYSRTAPHTLRRFRGEVLHKRPRRKLRGGSRQAHRRPEADESRRGLRQGRFTPTRGFRGVEAGNPTFVPGRRPQALRSNDGSQGPAHGRRVTAEPVSRFPPGKHRQQYPCSLRAPPSQKWSGAPPEVICSQSGSGREIW
jgi:hypothetical protein